MVMHYIRRLERCCFVYSTTHPTVIYTLSLHDALPILIDLAGLIRRRSQLDDYSPAPPASTASPPLRRSPRSEEHTSELQSHHDLVCRLLLEKKKRSFNRLPPPSSLPHNPTKSHFIN